MEWDKDKSYVTENGISNYLCHFYSEYKLDTDKVYHRKELDNHWDVKEELNLMKEIHQTLMGRMGNHNTLPHKIGKSTWYVQRQIGDGIHKFGDGNQKELYFNLMYRIEDDIKRLEEMICSD